MQQEPSRAAPRVFWIVDNGRSQRGAKAARELAARYPPLLVVQLPPPASWLNQVELSCSITPNAFADLAAVAARLVAYEALYNRTAPPFTWTFPRADLLRPLAQLELAQAAYPYDYL